MIDFPNQSLERTPLGWPICMWVLVPTGWHALFVAIMSLAIIGSVHAEEKQLWAKSILNQKAPELVVEKWLSEKPSTEGKFVLIDFWATWCPPCREAISELNEYQKKYKDKLVVIGISDESPETVSKFESPKIEYSSAIDTQATTKKALEVVGIPHVIIIDPKGVVRWEGFPFLDGYELNSSVLDEIFAQYGDSKTQPDATAIAPAKADLNYIREPYLNAADRTNPLVPLHGYSEETNPEKALSKIVDNLSQIKTFRADIEEEDKNYINKRTSVVTQKTDTNGDVLVRINIEKKFRNDKSVAENELETNDYIIENNNGIYGVHNNSILNLNPSNGMTKIKPYFISDWQLDSIITSSPDIKITEGLLGENEYWVITKKIPPAIYNAQITALTKVNTSSALKLRPTEIATSKVLYYFDKKSYIPIQKKAFNESGKMLYSITISNFSTNFDVNNDYFQLPKDMKITSEEQERGKRVKLTVQIGKPLSIKFTAVDGREVDLSAMKGKVVLVDFWATWCGPCVAEIPDVKETYEKFHDQDFEVVGISFDKDKSKLEHFIKQNAMPWPQLLDASVWHNQLGEQFDIEKIPTMWLIGKDGNLADINAGDGLAYKVQKLLEEK